jgi:hypothetical protein
VKRAGELRGLHANSRRQIKKSNAGVSQCLLKPDQDITWQNQTLPLDQFRDLPTADRWNANAGLFGRSDEIAMGIGESGIAVNPPNPNVCIEDDHRTDSQSLAATGSVGAIKDTGLPRRE